MRYLALYIWISLKERPMIGAVCSIATTLLGNCYDFVTKEPVLKLLSSLGMWMGFLIALLTFVIKVLDVRDRLTRKTQNPDKP